MDKRARLIDLAGTALIAAALGCALTIMLLSALTLSVPPGPVLIVCACAALMCGIGGWSRWGRAVALSLLGLAAVLLALPPVRIFSQIGRMLAALIQLGGESEALLTDYGALAGMLLGAMLSALLYWMARMSGGVYPALTLSMILLMGAWLLENRLDAICALTVVAALAAMFARASDEKISYLRAVPAALLAAALALALLPAGNVTWPPLQQAAQKARDLFSDYFMFTDPRTTYSISADGFQSRGELLGGPAQPELKQVMLVKTDETLLLRGSIKRTYTTYSWTESAVNSRYVFIDPTRRAIRDKVFDSNREGDLSNSGAFFQARAEVTMLSPGISTLFVPHRLTDFSAALDLATYFSSSGEVFITRSVQPGDSYSFTALIPTGNVSATRALLSSAAVRGGDSGYTEALSSYTSLPQGIDQRVYQLAQRLTEGQSTPYDKALAIQNHLLSQYTYSLEVDYPPQGRDFVSYFLLESNKGYCSYFASAMAVMARAVGLPARYVEGYLAPARADGVTIVTGKNAHAWVEIYFEGMGWISFNPTPGDGDSYQPPSGEGGESAGGEDGAQDGGAEPTPEPTQEPGGEDEPEGEDQAESEDEPEGEDNPEDQPEEEPEDSPEDAQSDSQAEKSRSWWWLLLLPLIALILLALRRLRLSDPRAMTRGRRGAADKLAIWYRALLLALEYQGQVPGPGETPEQFAARLTHSGLAGQPFADTARQLSLNRYAARKVDAAALKQARAAYERAVSQLKPLEKARWLSRRVLHGLGSAQRIP